jgi:alpha-L-rhamnosidase
MKLRHLSTLCLALAASLGMGEISWAGEPIQSEQFDAKRLDFSLGAAKGFIILPAKDAADGAKPWVWYAPTFIGGHPDPSHAWMARQLLDAGFAIGGVDVGESYGSPDGTRAYNAFYAHVRRVYGLDPRPCLLAQSRGGLMLLNWVAENADQVACVAGIYTVCNLESYPGVERASKAYGMDAAALHAKLSQYNPIETVKALADRQVPQLFIHGDSDTVVPIEKNSGELVRRSRALGGNAKLITVAGKGHEVCPEFFQSTEVINFLLSQGKSLEELHTTDPKCENLVDPLGIDVTQPRMSWVLTSPQRGQKQTAYQVLVASSPELLTQRQGDLWDSGRVASDRSIHVAYAGKPLQSRMQCYWKVRVWDKDGKPSAWSEPAFFSMGLLDVADWGGAQWIGTEDTGVETSQQPGQENNTRLPARYLRREFEADKQVRRATAYVCGLGFFDLFLNGNKVGDHTMDPALSGYKKRAFYVTFDVTDAVKPGNNVAGVILGNGRYFGPRKISPGDVPVYGHPKLLLHMRIEYDDGSVANIVSDEAWKMTADGPIRANNEFDGEEYDARMEIPNWSGVGFDDTTWDRAEAVDPPGGVSQSQMLEPMRIVEVRKPVAITTPKPDMYLVDMGQAYYGTVRLKVTGPAGTRVQMRSAYNVNPDGTLRSRDNRTALSTDVYTLKGQGTETWNPRFRGQGYRYVEVTGFPGVPTAENFEGLVIHTDFDAVGGFRCSQPTINKIYENIRWGQRAYIRSLSMEPDRDERQGWLGTQAKDFESNAFNFQMAPLLTKWLADIRLDQRPDGQIPDVSPTYWSLYNDGIVWPSNIMILPELQYDFYGDLRPLKENYNAMKKWMTFISRHLKPDSTVDHNRYGDWCDAYSMDGGKETGGTPGALISTAYYYNNCRIMARAARLLENTDDATRFAELAEKIKTGFNRRFFKPDENKYDSGTQTSYVLPLAFGMVDPARRDAVAANLAHDVMVTREGHLSVGMVGIFWLMQVLSETGHHDAAYTIATQTTRPSWGYMISKGATSVWERWDTDTRGPGMNSEALLILAGNVEAWFYQTLGGINADPEHPGFKHTIIRPRPTGDLTWAKAHHDSIYGRIAVDWRRDGEKLTLNVTIPAGTTATVFAPTTQPEAVTESGRPASESPGVTFKGSEDNCAVFEIGSGQYTFCASSA